MRFLARGKRSIVFLIKYKGKTAVLKQETRNLNVLQNEVHFLKILNNYGIGPKLLDHRKNKIILEYVKGLPLLKYIENSNKTKIKKVIRNILNQCYILDSLKINKFELTNPYKDIIVSKKPVMIDFERARFTNSPKNLTQFSQFLISKKIVALLGNKINRSKLINALVKYKNNQSKENFSKIAKILS